MGLGGTAKKIQKVTKVAEELYKKMNEVMQQMQHMQEDFEQTSAQVDRLERDLAEQRALLEAVAKQQDVDIEAVVESADTPHRDESTTAGDTDEDADEETDISVATSRPSEVDDE